MFLLFNSPNNPQIKPSPINLFFLMGAAMSFFREHFSFFFLQRFLPFLGPRRTANNLFWLSPPHRRMLSPFFGVAPFLVLLAPFFRPLHRVLIFQKLVFPTFFGPFSFLVSLYCSFPHLCPFFLFFFPQIWASQGFGNCPKFGPL